jgi:hypothetical protein
MSKMTHAEAVRALERLAKRWPNDLILFGSNFLAVVREDSDYDNDYGGEVIATINIRASGGDPD